MSDFRSQIDIAYLLGVIEHITREHLHTIREIRNRFAHRLETHDFTTQLIKDLCNKLWNTPRIQNLKSFLEQRVNDNVLNIMEAFLGPIVTLPDTPRNSYMGTIKVHLFWMEMSTVFAEQDKVPMEERKPLRLDLAVPNKQIPSPEKSEQQLLQSPHARAKRVRQRRPSPS
jgi:hypothetical protein